MPLNPVRRIAITAALLLTLSALVATAIIYHYNDFYPLKSLAATLPTVPAPYRGERILVFAPHPDDETLGAGGYIEAAERVGANVHIVVVTAGDAFRASVEYWYHTLNPSPTLFRRYGALRADEARQADSILGVPVKDISFLGFPDEGTGPLWLRYWNPEVPFTSPTTGADRVPYAFALKPGTAYTAPDELALMKSVLARYRPQVMITLQPNDVHPDHWATGNFSVLALQEWRDTGAPWARRTVVLRYLVHRGEWPLPKGYHPNLPLLPPPQLRHLGFPWYRFPLTAGETATLHRAILAYRTQTSLMKEFLVSFARQSELFAEYPTVTVPVNRGYSTIAIRQIWHRDPAVIMDPLRDTLLRDIDGSADLHRLTLAANGRHLLLRLQVRDRIHPSAVTYRIRIYRILSGAHGDTIEPLRLDLSTQRAPRVYDVLTGSYLPLHPPQVIHNNELQTALPLSLFRNVRHFMAGVSSRQGGLLVDRTATRMFRLGA